MADIKIITDLIISTAEEIAVINKSIKEDFEDVKRAMGKLDSSWDGKAATEAMQCFNSINAQFGETRYNIMDNYVNFLRQYVAPSYENAENVNVKLAEAFK